MKSVVFLWLVAAAIVVFAGEPDERPARSASSVVESIKTVTSGDLAGSGLNVHMSFNIRYKGHTISVYESMSNQVASSSDTLKYFYVPLMFPVSNPISQKWLWTAENGSELRLSLAVGNDEIERLIHDTIANKKSTNPTKINVAPMIIKYLSGVITSGRGDPIPGIDPHRFVNPTQMALIFRFKCSSAQRAKTVTTKLLDGDYNIELAFYFAGLHTISMNMVKITGETLKSVVSSTTADGGNSKAQFIHRKQASKFVAEYMANVKKTIYTENPNADTTTMIVGLEDQFKTLMQQAMDSSTKTQLNAKLFDQIWSADDLKPDRITKELSKIFKENKDETDFRNDGEQYYDFNQEHAQGSEGTWSASAKAKFSLLGSAAISASASHKQSSSGKTGNKTKLVVSKQDIEKYFQKEQIDMSWEGDKIVPKSFTVSKLTDITDRLQVALVAKQLIAQKSSGAEMKVFNVMDVPVPGSVAQTEVAPLAQTEVAPLALTGEIRLYAGGGQPPLPWLLCNGLLVSQTEYSRLFSVIGDSYSFGVNVTNMTTFYLPDFRGRVPVGVDKYPAVRATWNALWTGQSGGKVEYALYGGQIPAHDAFDRMALSYSSGLDAKSVYDIGEAVQAEYIQVVLMNRSNTLSRRLSGDGETAPFSVMQPYLTVNYIIYSG